VKNRLLSLAFLCMLLPAGLAYGKERVSLWERMCAACHDGKTVLNGKVVIDKGQMKAKYKTMDELVSAACSGPSCMNILKHDEALIKKVGREIGMPGEQKK